MKRQPSLLSQQTNYCNLARVHAAENSKSFDEIEFEKMFRAKCDEEYNSMIGVVRETPPKLVLPDNIVHEKAAKSMALIEFFYRTKSLYKTTYQSNILF